ncbi:LPXTG cell wall anchor domain-containing protein [Companilactobacillus sp. HBUAS56257]|uniref:LPXTG cell wall anchor domain-containing protein n=1 Tax=Companilactobacillus sp. HBUAS56257 TaxID=3109360 RepID=UPI002FEE9105
MKKNNSTTFSRIKYKDLAIAVALSGASLLLFPSTAKAATNEDPPINSTTSTLVQKNNEASNAAITTKATAGSETSPTLNKNTTGTSDVSSDETSNTSATNSSVSNASDTSNTSSDEASDTSTATSLANNTNNTETTNNSQVITSTTDNSATPTTNTTDTEPAADYTLNNNGNFIPAYKVPDSGMSITNIPNSTPNSLGQYNVSVQAVTNDGKVIGSPVSAYNGYPGSSVTISPTILKNELSTGMASSPVTYIQAPWNKDYDQQPLTINLNNSNIMVSVYFEAPSTKIHYEFMDETTGKEIVGGTRPYHFETNASLKDGIEVPKIVQTDSGFSIEDNSDYAGSAISNVQYFGPTGMILNNSYYILDPTKSNGITPLDIMQYPVTSQEIIEQFWYKRATAPTMTIDATDQFGNVIKTFSTSTISPTDKTVTPNQILPPVSETNIDNNTLNSITVIETNSLTGQPDQTTTYQITPSQYESLLSGNQTDYDYRSIGDHQNVEVQLGYTTNSIPLYIQPVDPKGNDVGAPIAVGTGVVGQNATIFAPTVTGYSPMTPSVSVTVTQNQGPIDFPYISATDIDPNDNGSYLYDGKFSSIPTTGIQVTNTGTASTDASAEHTISLQAVDTSGNPLGALIPVSSAPANSTYPLSWTPSLVKLLNSSVKNVSQYELWNANALAGELDVPVKNQDVVIDVIYALPKVTTTYNYVDENTGKTLLTQTNTWNLDDPTNGSTFKSQGIRPPMTIIDPDSGQLTADDLTPTPQTNPADLPFFGPGGTVFNTGQYQLNSLMSGLTTPTRYITWPSSNVTKTFYYMENPDPTITLDAVNQEGNVIKTFNAPTVVSTLPAPQLSPAADFPTVAQATINGYTLTGIKVHATGSYFGGTDTDYSYNLTPDQYAEFISSPDAQSTMDERALAAHSNFGIHFTYTGNPVTLMVQPVDENGVKIGNPISAGSGIVGSSATLTAPEIANYKAVNPTSTITVSPDQGTVEMQYTKVDTTNPDTGNTGSGSSTGPDTGNTGSGSVTNPDSGNTSSGSSTDPDTGNTGSGSTTNPDTGNTGSGSSTGSDTGNTGSGSVTNPDSGNTSSGSTTNPDTGNTGSSSTTNPDTGNTGSGSSTSSDTGNTGSGSVTNPDTGNTGSGSSTNPDTGNTDSGSSTNPDTGNTGGSGSTTNPDTSNTGSSSVTNSDTGNTGSNSTTNPDSGNTGSGSSTNPDTGNTGSIINSDTGNSDSNSVTDTNNTNSSPTTSLDSNTTIIPNNNETNSNNEISNHTTNINNSTNNQNTATESNLTTESNNNVNENSSIKNLSNEKHLNNSNIAKANKLNLTNSQFTNATNEKLPQTGNKFTSLLSVIGLAILGAIGLCWKKIRKFI